MLPGMIPVALLGSAVYMVSTVMYLTAVFRIILAVQAAMSTCLLILLDQGLQLSQSRLAHEKFLDEAREQVRQLEEEVDKLQKQRALQESTVSSSRTSTFKWWPW